jgi:nucleotide-binding universal stress UspA family protein
MERHDDELTPVERGVFRRMLVGFDGSEGSVHALRVTRSLAADVGGEVHVLMVIQPPAHAETDEERRSSAEAERSSLSLRLASSDAASADVTTHVILADHPAVAIAEYAAEHGFDLVVVGTHGRERATHGGIGSSLDALLRDHPCPVLVV